MGSPPVQQSFYTPLLYLIVLLAFYPYTRQLLGGPCWWCLSVNGLACQNHRC